MKNTVFLKFLAIPLVLTTTISVAQSTTFKYLKGPWVEPTKKDGLLLTFLNDTSVLFENGKENPKRAHYKLGILKKEEIITIIPNSNKDPNKIPKYFIRKIDNNKIALQEINEIGVWKPETNQNIIYLVRVKQNY